MKYSIRVVLLSLTVLFIAGRSLAFQPGAGEPSFQMSLVNTLSIERPDEPVILHRADLEKKLGPIAEGKYIQVKGTTGAPIPVQLDDLDGDGRWDEAFFIHHFTAREKFRLSVTVTDRPAAIKIAVRAHVRMRAKNEDGSFGPLLDSVTMSPVNAPTDFTRQRLPPWLTEGPAWENDRIAYRLYFDTRNGKDIYGKRIPAMVMDEVGADTTKSYHNLADWGMDVLKVGSSLGAGALAISVPVQGGRDTLIRLGGKQVKKEVFRKIADGPLRAIFSIQYEWEINGSPVHIIEQVSIPAGRYYYESKVLVKGAPAGSRLVTGIANFYTNEPGNFSRDQAKVLYSHGRQSENKDIMGMAILVGKKDFSAFRSLPATGSEINSTYTVAQNIYGDKPLYFRFYTCWEKTDPAFASIARFKDLLLKDAAAFSHPILTVY